MGGMSTETGRAVLAHGPQRPMEIVDLPVPDPAPGCIVVRVTRANVCGSDLHIWRGDGRLSRMVSDEGFIPGHEMTGVVHALGPGVTHDWAGQPLKEGDRVVYQYFAPCGRCRACLRDMTEACPLSFAVMRGRPADHPHFRGAYADYYYVTERQAVFRVPDRLTDTMIAGVNCALAQVVHGLERVDVRFGDVVVIQGAGGLGIYATAVARDRGAHQIIVIDGLDDRLELARAMGADEVIDFREHGTPEARWGRVRELTGGWGAGAACRPVRLRPLSPRGLRRFRPRRPLLRVRPFYLDQ